MTAPTDTTGTATYEGIVSGLSDLLQLIATDARVPLKERQYMVFLATAALDYDRRNELVDSIADLGDKVPRLIEADFDEFTIRYARRELSALTGLVAHEIVKAVSAVVIADGAR